MIQTTTHPKHHFSTWYLATCLKFCMRTLNYVFIHHLSGMHLGSCKYFCILRFMMCQPHLTIFITFSTIQTLLLLWKTLSKGFKEVFSNGIVKCDRQRPPTEIGTFSYTVFKPKISNHERIFKSSLWRSFSNLEFRRPIPLASTMRIT